MRGGCWARAAARLESGGDAFAATGRAWLLSAPSSSGAGLTRAPAMGDAP